MKRLAVCLALLCASALHAQVTESIDVRIVNVDVTVTSKGAPVSGLTRDDFDIFEDGKLQKITNFYASEARRAVVASATAANTTPAPAAEPEQDPRFRRKVLVLVDNHHTTRHCRDKALLELEAMINDRFHADNEWSIGVIGRGITLVLPLSSDKNAIHEALEIIRKSGTRSEGSMTFTGASDREGSMLASSDVKGASWSAFDHDYAQRLGAAANADEAESTLAARYTVPAYLDALRGFASTTGRKIVLLLTGDPGLNDAELVPHNPGGGEIGVRGFGRQDKTTWSDRKEMENLRQSIVHEANASDTSFYIWNVEGLIPKMAADVNIGGRPFTDNSAVFWIAKETGGRLVAGNDAARAIREFDTASSSFYSLGYAPSHPDDGRYHAINVRLKQRGDYKLEYRTGYSSSSTSAQLERAMSSPTAAAMQANALPVTLALGTPKAERAEVTVPIEVKVPFRDLQFLPGKSGVNANLMLYVSVFNDIGKNLVATSTPLTPGFKADAPDLKGILVYRNAIKLRQGERHRIVVAIRDITTDSVGMATEVVKF
jgi:VWFA-related protein